MKKLAVVITDGIGFILSDFLVEAEKEFDEVVSVCSLTYSFSRLIKESC